MRIPAPDRLNSAHVAMFTAVIFIGQVAEGTNFLFAVLTAVYTLLWVSAFNISGGLSYPSGAFIFFNGLLNVEIGLGFKVLLGQPGERNLVAGNSTMFVYCVGMAAILCVAFLTRSLRPQRGFLRPLDSVEEYRKAAIVCLSTGSVLYVLSLIGVTNQVLSVLRQINKLPQLGIVLATVYEITRSGGKRSFNWIVTSGMIFMFIAGLFSFGKEGMLLGFAAYMVAAVLSGYDFPKIQIVISALLFAFFSYYLVPYSQYARGFRATTAAGNLAVAAQYLGNLSETRRLYEDILEDFDISGEPHLYDKREGFIDRLIVLPSDDALIAYTNEGHVFGLSPTYAAFANAIPRFLWHSKPVVNAGNTFAHELGELLEDDTTTGVSFSATAEAYHEAKWLGVMLLMPLVVFLYCIIGDSIVGSAKWAPWAMIPILDVLGIGPDGGLSGPIYYFTYAMFGMCVIYWIIKVGAPFVLRTLSARHAAPIDVSNLKPVAPRT